MTIYIVYIYIYMFAVAKMMCFSFQFWTFATVPAGNGLHDPRDVPRKLHAEHVLKLSRSLCWIAPSDFIIHRPYILFDTNTDHDIDFNDYDMIYYYMILAIICYYMIDYMYYGMIFLMIQRMCALQVGLKQARPHLAGVFCPRFMPFWQMGMDGSMAMDGLGPWGPGVKPGASRCLPSGYLT